MSKVAKGDSPIEEVVLVGESWEDGSHPCCGGSVDVKGVGMLFVDEFFGSTVEDGSGTLVGTAVSGFGSPSGNVARGSEINETKCLGLRTVEIEEKEERQSRGM